MSNDAKIDLLKRCSRSLSNVYRDYPTDQTYSDLYALEQWIEELGGDARTGTHRAIMDGSERSD